MKEEVKKEVEESGVSDLKGRSKMRSILSGIHPDKQYSDDSEEDIDDFLAEHEDLSSKHSTLNDSASRLAEGIKNNPNVAKIIQDIIDGNNPVGSIVKTYGKGISELDPDSDDFRAIIEAEDERMRKLAEDEERSSASEAEFSQNLAASDAEFERFSTEKGIDKDAFADFMQQFYSTFAEPIFQGKFTQDILNAAWKGLNYDGDTADAFDAGKVAAKNEKIVAMKRDKVGDGVPGLRGNGAATVAGGTKSQGGGHKRMSDYL